MQLPGVPVLGPSFCPPTLFTKDLSHTPLVALVFLESWPASRSLTISGESLPLLQYPPPSCVFYLLRSRFGDSLPGRPLVAFPFLAPPLQGELSKRDPKLFLCQCPPPSSLGFGLLSTIPFKRIGARRLFYAFFLLGLRFARPPSRQVWRSQSAPLFPFSYESRTLFFFVQHDRDPFLCGAMAPVFWARPALPFPLPRPRS